MKTLKLLKQTLLLALLTPALWWPCAALAAVPAPAGFQVFSGPAQSVLQWTPVTGATGYAVQRAFTSGGPYTLLASPAGDTYTDSAVTNGAEYYYVVAAVSNSVTGANSVEGAAIPLAAGNYAFINSYSGLALTGSSGGATQQNYTGTSQIWQLVAQSGQFFLIVNPVNDALVAATAASQQLIVATGYANNNIWEFEVTNGSSYLVINTGLNQVMDDYGPSTTAGTEIGAWGYDGGINQNWFITVPALPALNNVALTNNGAATVYTFTGQVNTSNLNTTVICNLGINTGYGVSVTNVIPGAFAPTNFSMTVTDAEYNATMHGLVTAQNAAGSVSSGDLTVAANIGLALIQSAGVTNDDQLPQAYVSAQINPDNLPTTVIIQFGTNTAYGQSVTNTLNAGGSNQPVSQTFSYPSLNVTTTLHAFITASNAAGITTSGDLTGNSLLFEKMFSSDFNTNGTTIGLAPVTGSAAWADLDNDGWLDLVCEGQVSISACQGFVYFNQTTNQQASGEVAHQGYWDSYQLPASGNREAIGVGDFDNDNIPDLLLTGGIEINAFNLPNTSSAGGTESVIAFGRNGTSFTNREFIPYVGYAFHLPGQAEYQDASVVVADFDHTGRQDAMVAGNIENNDFGLPFGTRIYQNALPWERANGVGPITNAPMNIVYSSIPNVGGDFPSLISSGQSVLAAGDFENDGFLDLFALNFFTNLPGPNYAGLFHGGGNLNFSLTTNTFQLYPNESHTELDYVETASSALADMNGDGNLDLVLSYSDQITNGNNFGVGVTTVGIWFNDGHGNLTNSNITLPQLQLANLAVGDIFNHGRNDILMVGYANPNYDTYPVASPPMETVVLRNDGNGVFTPVVLGNFGCIGETGHGLALGDYDNDGRLDFAMTGDAEPARIAAGAFDDYATFDPATHIFRNEMNIPSNAPPAAPPGLSTTVGNGTVTFHWGNATDDITPAILLTYNLRVGTNSLDTSVVSPLANVTTGWRKIVAPGNCGHTTNTLYRFPPGTYYWSVQAVDGGFKGGAWAPEQTFTITNAEPVSLTLGPPAGASLVAGAQAFPINTNANVLNLSWPIRQAGWTLVQSPSLTNPVWTTNNNVGTWDGQWSVMVTNNTGGTMFYRLVQ